MLITIQLRFIITVSMVHNENFYFEPERENNKCYMQFINFVIKRYIL